MIAAPSGCLLEVSDLRKSYPGVQALAGVDLAVHHGEVHALVGENGAGKSTLIKILGGAHRPEAGRIRLDGRDLDISLELQPNVGCLVTRSTSQVQQLLAS